MLTNFKKNAIIIIVKREEQKKQKSVANGAIGAVEKAQRRPLQKFQNLAKNKIKKGKASQKA